jgi:hypothetical protein
MVTMHGWTRGCERAPTKASNEPVLPLPHRLCAGLARHFRQAEVNRRLALEHGYTNR